MKSSSGILNIIAQCLFDKKAYNILILDLKGICTIADYFIIAEGSVARHVKALADHLIAELKPICGAPTHVSGEQFANWIILDYSGVMVHLFLPEVRERYGLEKLWNQGKVVDVAIDIEQHSPTEENS